MTKRQALALVWSAAALVLLPVGAVAHPGGVTLSGVGMATVDGVVSPAEWASAGTLSFLAKVPGGGTAPATLRVMNDGSNLYVSLTVDRVDAEQTVSLSFDNDHDGSVAPEEGDDGLSFGAFTGGPGLNDNVRTSRPPCPGGSFCGMRDTEAGGTIDGSAARSTVGEATHFELSHPLNSADDLNDFSLVSGATIGFWFRYAIFAAGTPVFTDPVGILGPTESDILIRPPDTFAPDTSITSGILDGGVTASTVARFSFTGTDDVAPPAALAFECSLDDATFTPCTSEHEYAGLAPGSHVFAVRARDPSGNTDPSPALRRWTVEAPPPGGGSGGGGGGGGTADVAVTIETASTAPKPGQTIEIRVTVANKEAAVAAAGLRLVLALPTGVTLLGPPAVERGSGCVGTTTLDCYLDYLPGAAATAVRFSVDVGAAGSKELTATATMNVRDSDETNNRATLTLAVAEPPSPVPPSSPADSGVTRNGTVRADVLRGTRGHDVLNGRGGNDRLFGLAGNDRLFGHVGADALDGGTGRDVLDGGAGADTIHARDGVADTVRCGTGRDRVVADRLDRIAGCEVVSRG